MDRNLEIEMVRKEIDRINENIKKAHESVEYWLVIRKSLKLNLKELQKTQKK
jgi:divalent metal cation (Fe/Co/Zn/Cd) transporter